MDVVIAKDKVLFSIISFFFWFTQFLYVPILSPYLKTLGGHYTFIGIVLSSYGLMQLFCRLPVGIFSDFLNMRKPFIVFGMMTATCSCLLFALTDAFIWGLIARCLAGLAAATWVAFTIMYANYFKENESQKAMNYISFIVVLAQLLGMSFSGYIVDIFGWKAPFWIGSFIGLIGLVLSLFILEQKTENKTQLKMKQLIKVAKEPALLKISLLSILAHSMIFTTMFGFTSTYALTIGMKQSELFYVVCSFMMPHTLAPLLLARLLKEANKRNILIGSFTVASFSIFMIPFIQQKVIFYINQGVGGLALGFIFPILLGMAIESVSQSFRATAMGAYQALYALGIFGGPFIAGMVNHVFGIAFGFYFEAILGVCAVGLIMTKTFEKIQNHDTHMIKRHT